MNAFLLDTIAQESCYSEKDLMILDPSRIPHHVAIIPDGNRRWAKRNGWLAILGHAQGAAVMPRVVQAASEIGIKVLTIWGFSTENWERSPAEVEALMIHIKNYLVQEREPMIRQGVRLEAIGDLEGLPADIRRELEITREATRHCSKIELVIALNYGGRDDIRRAVNAILKDYAEGKLPDKNVSEEMFAQYLDTARWKDPDLFIRTSGEKRISNFLNWQLSYTEVYITDVLWPDFNEKELLNAVLDFQHRERRWGR